MVDAIVGFGAFVMRVEGGPSVGWGANISVVVFLIGLVLPLFSAKDAFMSTRVLFKVINECMQAHFKDSRSLHLSNFQ